MGPCWPAPDETSEDRIPFTYQQLHIQANWMRQFRLSRPCHNAAIPLPQSCGGPL